MNLSDNITPFSSNEYEQKINNTIPYYNEFHNQTISVVKNMGFKQIKWLDLGCGTGTLANKADKVFDNISFVMIDPSEKMLKIAKQNNSNITAEYISGTSENINYTDEFEVITAVLSNHYMNKEQREKATEKIYKSLHNNGIYITFENVVSENLSVKKSELQRWGQYQKENGKSEKEVFEHINRCGKNYFPITVNQHIDLLKCTGFRVVHMFWYSYMQMGIYAIK